MFQYAFHLAAQRVKNDADVSGKILEEIEDT